LCFNNHHVFTLFSLQAAELGEDGAFDAALMEAFVT
jgi:hypothetical protein